MKPSVFSETLKVLLTSDPVEKSRLANELYEAWEQGALSSEAKVEVRTIEKPGRPSQPELVDPKFLPKRKLNSLLGKAALLHAIAHIEFNAINLALDAVYRFQEMPDDYYSDWLKIAVEEAYHFGLVKDYLEDCGYHYGDFPAHNGLWEMALETDHDVLVRMALVPRILEARGLDVNPGIQEKLASIGDTRAVEILKIIERDEIGHVACGNHWYRYLCKERDYQPLETFKRLIQKHAMRTLRGPFAIENRIKAGFTEAEMTWIQEHAVDYQI